jgi:HEAT repeat protein
MRWRSAKLLLVTVVLLGSGVVARADTPQDGAWRILQAGVADNSAEVQVAAVSALGLLLHNPRAAAMAEKALEDDRPEVRAAAARALGQMLSTASIPKLRKALADEEHSVVMAAAHSLVQLKDPAGYELYYSVLTGERKQGDNLISQEMDILKDPKKVAEFCFLEGVGFIPYGGYGLSAAKFVMKQEQGEPAARAAAARVLATDPDPQSREALVRAVSDKSWLVREAALAAIARRADPSLLGRIRAAMSDENDRVRYTAAAAVIRLTDVRETKQGSKQPWSRAQNQHQNVG